MKCCNWTLAAALLLGFYAAGAAAEVAPAPLPQVKPEDVGLSSARLDRMAEFLREQSRKQAAPGYVLMVARNGKLAYTAIAGMRNIEQAQPMTLDTRFRIASMTKPITSVAVLMLYEEGRFQLDDPVAAYLPEYANMQVLTSALDKGKIRTEPARRPISIRHLLVHNSGMGYGAGLSGDNVLSRATDKLDLHSAPDLASVSQRLATVPLYFHPGESWRYSYSDDVLGRLVEVVSGMPFEQFLQQRLFGPLGMTDTGFALNESSDKPLMTMYRHDAHGALIELDEASAPQLFHPPAWPSGGGGLISTASDYLRFAQMLANGGTLDGTQYLSPVTVALMASNQIPDDAQRLYWGDNSIGLGFGLGLGVTIDAAHAPLAGLNGDYGWGGYFDTRWIVSPRSGLVAVLLTQVAPWPGTPGQRTYVDFNNVLYGTVQNLDLSVPTPRL